MQEINLEFNEDHLKTQKEIISFKCELNENLQQAMKDFMDKHPHWDQYRIIQAAIAGFLMQNDFNNRNLTRLYVGNMFAMNFENQ
tara:strand:+ start:845 stop:1099 length:255 start_codon:yes stop_codon:yes gene_type:complete